MWSAKNPALLNKAAYKVTVRRYYHRAIRMGLGAGYFSSPPELVYH
jgi:hypothetical protein